MSTLPLPSLIGPWLSARWLRIDPRSLALFRIAMGLTLVADLLDRWSVLPTFYSNAGLLPNHSHLYQHRELSHVWSLFHSASSIADNHVGFALSLLIYLAFTLGLHTRVAHFSALLVLVSLVGRNVLLEGLGTSAAISLLALSLALPLGRRLSFDALRRSFQQFREVDARQLNDRSRPAKAPPQTSLTGLFLLLLLGLIYLSAALQQTGGSWRDGTALYYALHVDRWTSAIGVEARALPFEILKAWSFLLRFTEFAVLPLALMPVARRLCRSVAISLMLLHGLSLALLFELVLYGGSLAAASALLLPAESWQRMRKRTRPLDLIYDDGCGICHQVVRLLKRLDLRRNLTFHPSGDSAAYPPGVDAETTMQSLVVTGQDGVNHTGGLALSEILRSLPCSQPLGWALRLPLLSGLSDRAYYAVAGRRLAISVWLGLGACGVSAGERPKHERPKHERPSKPSPARKLLRSGAATSRELMAAFVFLVVLAQTQYQGQLPLGLGLGDRRWLTSAADWLGLEAQWGLWAPNAPRLNEALVFEALTADGRRVDVLSGMASDLTLRAPQRLRRGALWARYGERIHQPAFAAYRADLGRYLLADAASDPKTAPVEVSVYWLSVAIPAPGEVSQAKPTLKLLLRQRAQPRKATTMLSSTMPKRVSSSSSGMLSAGEM